MSRRKIVFSENSFGNPERYYSADNALTARSVPSGESREEGMIKKLLESYDRDLQNKVQRTFRQWNNIIREYLRSETALRLTVGDDQQAVPVRILPGLPKPFADIVRRYGDPQVWELYFNRLILSTSVEGHRLVKTHSELICQGLLKGNCPATAEELTHSCELFERLTQELDKLQLKEAMKQIHQDILGAYFFRVPEVRLYWMVIGVVAGMINVPVEGLTVAVLIHELTHAYSHLGRDIDGRRWETEQFAQCDQNIVEGLAQFYTAVISKKFEQRFPSVKKAYDALLEIQAGPYRVHEEWEDGEKRVGEIVRFAMINTRSRNVQAYEGFKRELEEIQKKFGKE